MAASLSIENGPVCRLQQLNLSLDQCKFYPLAKRCVLAGTIVSPIDDSGFECIDISQGDRCLVYYSEEDASVLLDKDLPTSVHTLMKSWNALECGNDKCTGWIKLVIPRSITCHFSDAKPTLKKSPQQKSGRGKGPSNSRNNDQSTTNRCWIWEHCIQITQNSIPERLKLTLALEQLKFYSTKLLVLDGSIAECKNDSTHFLTGERCWIHVRSGIKTLLKRLQPGNGASAVVNQSLDPTGWIQFTQSLTVQCLVWRIPTKDDNNQLLSRNPKTGALLLECDEIKKIFFLSGNSLCADGDLRRLGDRSFRSNTHGVSRTLPALQDRKERHTVFAKWLVDKFGVEYLSRGSGVLDVAGGKGELCQALLEMGVQNATLLDPDPRCDSEQVRFQVIGEPLTGDGSNLTNNIADDRIGRLVCSCSLIAGMHPDGATEAIINTSLRLGVPFAILPCCFSQKLFPKRTQHDGKKLKDTSAVNPYQSYSIFCQHLLKMAPIGLRFEVENLPFQGRNKLIYFSNYACQAVAQ